MGPLPEVESFSFISHSPEETQQLGAILGNTAQSGDVILLTGELGTGKTCLTQGIAWGLGVKEYAFSPSFVLVREYTGRLVLFHIDLYRLERIEEIVDLGLDDYLHGDGICVVEWADRGPHDMAPENLLIEITHFSETQRTLALSARGERCQKILSRLKSEVRRG